MNNKASYKKDKKRLPEIMLSRQSYSFAYYFSIIAIASTVSILAAILTFDMVDDALALSVKETPTMAEINVEKIYELPDKLGKAGIIKHPWLFELYLHSKNASDDLLKRKSATVSANMDYRALLKAFTTSTATKTVRITIPQTASTDEIINIFTEHGIGTREGFEAVIGSYPFDFDFIDEIPTANGRTYRLDGYLYPDTYDFYTGRDESYYIHKLLERFDIMTNDIQAVCKENGTSFDDALIIASMIQCSCAYVSQYETLSAVIRNRLEADEYLAIPASAAYAKSRTADMYVGEASDELKSIVSPYNTFKNKGLPPGAICNPDRNAILCAVYPDDSDYMYFVTEKDGSVRFDKAR